MRRRIVAANWKMHETATTGAALAHDVVARLDALAPSATTVDVVIAPPFTALSAVGPVLAQSGRASLGAQNMHWEPAGPYTGEISAPMLLDLGVRYVILGHSERRQFFAENDATVNRKVKAALASGLHPIVAVGETLETRTAGDAVAYVTAQTSAALDGLPAGDIARIALAYEPIWAIGTGMNCEPGDADAVMGAMRACDPALRDAPILYGGSVKPDNFAGYLERTNVDGGLIGGSSLDAAAFVELVHLAIATA